MVIRSYTADSVASALKQVRTEMGRDAVVLKTRTVEDVTGGRVYEVTACLDKPTAAQADQVLTTTVAEEPPTTSPRVNLDHLAVDEPSETPTAPSRALKSDSAIDDDRFSRIERQLQLLMKAQGLELDEPETEPTILDRLTESLRNSDLSTELIDNWVEQIAAGDDRPVTHDDIFKFVTDKTEALIDDSLEFKPGDRVLVSGLPGAGKTSVVGRLAAHLIIEKKTPVRLLSFDNAKVGAHDEIASYADLLGVSAPKVDETDSKPTGKRDDDKVLLIDTGALPTDDERRHEFEQKIERYKPTHRLVVFSALTRSVEIESTAQNLDWLAPSHLAMTHADLTDRFGGLYVATEKLGIKLVMLTNTPHSSGSWPRPDAATIVTGLLPEAKSE